MAYNLKNINAFIFKKFSLNWSKNLSLGEWFLILFLSSTGVFHTICKSQSAFST